MITPAEKVICHHCGDDCNNQRIQQDGYDFCCMGCHTIYNLFQDVGLEDLYAEASRHKPGDEEKYDYLANKEIVSTLLKFDSREMQSIEVQIPAIHCSACVYVLENLHLFHNGFIRSSVDFINKNTVINFDPQSIKLQEVAIILDRIGYPITFDTKNEPQKKTDNGLVLKIGVAGFCFGNIMLFSFPGYLGIDVNSEQSYILFFGYLSLLLSLPALLYSGNLYFESAWKGLRQRIINIDLPIALGMLVLFSRSAYEIISQTGQGYFDSLAGLIFFLLLGRWFQSKTYERLAFDRDYKSYFPLTSNVISDSNRVPTLLKDLRVNDIIEIRNGEIIPADGQLLSDNASIDYSFVSGEERPMSVAKGEKLYAGGRQVGSSIKLRLSSKSSQSYLTSMWEHETFSEEDTHLGLTDKISQYFTLIVLSITAAAGLYWFLNDVSLMWEVMAAILIVACPCALALSAPFVNGHTLRILGRNGLYLKNALIAEQLDKVKTIVFDKTGTLTSSKKAIVVFHGIMDQSVKTMIFNLVRNSIHPVSNSILTWLGSQEQLIVDNFKEVVGQGIEGFIGGKFAKIGKALYINPELKEESGRVYISIDNEVYGYFEIKNALREGIAGTVKSIDQYNVVVLSGDNDSDKALIQQIAPDNATIKFEQSPKDKLNYIKEIQKDGAVMMIGDGLNDAGALKQSDIGIAVSEDASLFSPACDAILEGDELKNLTRFLKLSQWSRGVIVLCFIVSFLYNVVGLTFAISGVLTPIFAAILMPLSSLSIVVITNISSRYLSSKLQL